MEFRELTDQMSNAALNLDSDPVSAFESAMASAGIHSDEIPIALLKWSNWTFLRIQKQFIKCAHHMSVNNTQLLTGETI